MPPVTRFFSRAAAKPYRTAHLDPRNIHINEDGYVDFVPGDVENPKNWTALRRTYVTVVAVLLVVNATFASSSPSGCLQSIAEEFSVSREAAGLTVTLFLLGYCAGPLVFAPLSEFYGRKWIFFITFGLYIAFNFLCAFASNFGSLLVGRFLTGTFVSSPLSNAPGVLADLWSPIARGNAMAGFSCMVWAGPALGPVISGFLELKKDWRWSFYVLLWMGGGTALLMVSLPETFAPIILKHKARRVRKAKIPDYENVKAPIEGTDRSLLGIYKEALTRPWIILKEGWNVGVGELPLIGTVIGPLLGAVIVLFQSYKQNKMMMEGKTIKPEGRLLLALIGGPAFAISIFWFAWTAEYNSVHWIVPTIAGVFVSGSMMLIFVAFFNYLVDTYIMYAASAIAANTVTRSAAGSAAPLFTTFMFNALGVGGGGSLLGGVAALLAIIPFMFYRYGERIRVKSKFAPTDKPRSGSDDVEKQRSNVGEDYEHEAERTISASSAATSQPRGHAVSIDEAREDGQPDPATLNHDVTMRSDV